MLIHHLRKPQATHIVVLRKHPHVQHAGGLLRCRDDPVHGAVVELLQHGCLTGLEQVAVRAEVDDGAEHALDGPLQLQAEPGHMSVCGMLITGKASSWFLDGRYRLGLFCRLLLLLLFKTILFVLLNVPARLMKPV